MTRRYPRLVVAGIKGDSGKTLVTLGLLLALREKGQSPVPFKKGPDFIDAAWLGQAAGTVGRNLDTYIMGARQIMRSFTSHAAPDGFNLIEGNRGLYDGMDQIGSHSTAELAKLLQAPTVLVLSITKMTRTAAAVVLGLKLLDPSVNLAGVVINQVAGRRHERVVTQAIEDLTGINVIGSIPKLTDNYLPGRHLGLVTPAEHPDFAKVFQSIAKVALDHIDIDQILALADSAPSLTVLDEPDDFTNEGRGLKIGMIADSAFTFYYPENIEALENEGVEMVKISSLTDQKLPEDIDALYIGGGFPETHLDRIVKNKGLLAGIKAAAENGLPIYAECGGLIFLSRSVNYEGKKYSLADVFPIDISISKKPQGHGYVEVEVDGENPFFEKGTMIRGHEFHYSGIEDGSENVQTAFSVKRGFGCFEKRDALIYKNTLACYIHLHAAGTPKWATGMIKAAKSYNNKNGKTAN